MCMLRPAVVSPTDVVGLGADDYTFAVHQGQELLQLLLDELSRRQGRTVLMLRVLDMAEVRAPLSNWNVKRIRLPWWLDELLILPLWAAVCW